MRRIVCLPFEILKMSFKLIIEIGLIDLTVLSVHFY